jgi:hypothetical protein
MSNSRTSELVISVINAHLPVEEAWEENCSDRRKIKKIVAMIRHVTSCSISSSGE